MNLVIAVNAVLLVVCHTNIQKIIRINKNGIHCLPFRIIIIIISIIITIINGVVIIINIMFTLTALSNRTKSIPEERRKQVPFLENGELVHEYFKTLSHGNSKNESPLQVQYIQYLEKIKL